MKKLSALIALLLCVTVGGVYATWYYVSDSADIVDVNRETAVQLENATTTGAAGSFTIESNLRLVIDQKEYGSATNKHEAELKFTSTDGNPVYLKVIFTPSANASESVHEVAVPAELYFTTSTAMQYKADSDGKLDQTNGTLKDIFLLDEKAATFIGDISWVKMSDGTFTAEYGEEELADMIALNGTIILDTKTDYDHFRTHHLTGSIIANVTDGQVPANT